MYIHVTSILEQEPAKWQGLNEGHLYAQNCKFREFALNEPTPPHYATLNFPHQFLATAPAGASSATTGLQ